MTIARRLIEIKARMAQAASGRAVALLAVSKTYSADRVREVITAGHFVFAENRVQESMAKFPALRAEYPDVRVHLIGPLQTNKVRDAVALFDAVHTVDRLSLAEKLANEIARQDKSLDCFIQVNTGAEPQKAGVSVADLSALLRFCREDAGLLITGLMGIPPVAENPAPHFAMLGRLADEHGLPFRSMGMSADFKEAIAHGATHIRVGSAIFGARN